MYSEGLALAHGKGLRGDPHKQVQGLHSVVIQCLGSHALSKYPSYPSYTRGPYGSHREVSPPFPYLTCIHSIHPSIHALHR